MTNEKKELIKKIAVKLEEVSVEDARYIQGYLEGKTEELEKEEKRSAQEVMEIKIIVMKLLVRILGKERWDFNAAIKYRGNAYIITVRKYRPVENLLHFF